MNKRALKLLKISPRNIKLVRIGEKFKNLWFMVLKIYFVLLTIINISKNKRNILF